MTQMELLRHLVGMGYPAQAFSVLGVGSAMNEGLVLLTVPEGWRIAYYERGAFSYEVETFSSEGEACASYLEQVKAVRVVLVMWPQLAEVENLQRRLSEHQIESRIHPLPESIFGVAQYQLVVAAVSYQAAARILCIENV